MNTRGMKLLVVALSTAMGLLIAEGISRLLPPRLTEDFAVLNGDPLLGIPPAVSDPAVEFPSLDKPADVYRIVVLGDSQMVTVAFDEAFPAVLARAFSGEDLRGMRVEIHNAGAPGHSHYQYYLALERRLERYDPDLVIVAPYMGNDFLDLLRNDDRPMLAFEAGQYRHRDPIFYKFHDPSGKRHWLTESSTFARFVALTARRAAGYEFDRVKILWGVGESGGGGSLAAARYVFAIARGSFVDQHVFRQSMNQILHLSRFPETQRDMERVNVEVLGRMKDLTDRRGMSLLYVPLPTRLQVDPDFAPEALERVLEVCGLDRDALKVEDRLYDSLKSELDNRDVAYVEVVEALRRGAQHATLYDDTHHMGAEAHAIVADALLEPIRTRVRAAARP